MGSSPLCSKWHQKEHLEGLQVHAVCHRRSQKPKTKALCIALGEEAPPEHIGSIEISFVPFQRDPEKVALYYQATDLYVHPARAETFPTTVLEALACGTPVMASRVGGIPEQAVEGRTGFLVPVGDDQAMAGRILNLLADDELRLRMGRQAAEEATQRFGIERVIKDYLLLYESMIVDFTSCSNIKRGLYNGTA